jgi:hypothetical protein
VSAEAWTAIATGVGVVLTLGGGFTVWMLRIDRAVMKASALPEALKALEARLMQAIQDLRGDNEREHQDLRRRQDELTGEIARHGERLATLEARKGQR